MSGRDAPGPAERKLWRALRRRKGREEHGRFLAEGPNLLEELLESGLPPERVLHTAEAARDPALAPLLARTAEAGAELTELEPSELEALADTVTPQGILAVAPIPRRGWPEVRAPRILVLDAVSDPGNVGTLVRTAEAVGLAGVVCLPGTADPWSPKVVRAAAGSSLRLPVLRASWEEARERIRERGAAVWAADPAGTPLRRWEGAPRALALVLGNEARGVSAAVLRDADRRVSLPMAGRVESLNVAAAGAILMDRIFAADG